MPSLRCCDLRYVCQSPKGGTVENSVAIAIAGASIVTSPFVVGVGGRCTLLCAFLKLSYCGVVARGKKLIHARQTRRAGGRANLGLVPTFRRPGDLAKQAPSRHCSIRCVRA